MPPKKDTPAPQGETTSPAAKAPVEPELRSITINFDYPVTFGGRTYATVQMVEPIVADQLAVELPGQTAGEFEARLVARQCNMPLDAVKTLRTCDYNKLSRAFATFMHGPKAV